MTRFARAQGSKASNARIPEEATSWSEMKQQMISNQGKPSDCLEAEQINSKIQAAKASLRAQAPSTAAKWAPFDDVGVLKKPKKSESVQPCNSPPEKTKDKKQKAKKRKSAALEGQESIEVENSGDHGNTKKTPKKGVIAAKESPSISGTDKKKNKKLKLSAASPPVAEEIAPDTLPSPKLKRKKNKHAISIEMNNSPVVSETQSIKPSHPMQQKVKPGKKEHKRRKPQEQYLMVDGRKVAIELFDNFPVKKEDAIRLRELKKKMLSQGIPKDEVLRAMKLERRRAEKALSRERRKLCFHCRGSGHMMSECPGLEAGACSVCFKCGSTEHMSSQCRVNRGTDYKFGQCFVCGEQGHIARQCPDNPRGLYPQGGSCKVCGDVTHLKKDCPQQAAERRDSAVTLGTSQGGPLEALEEDGTSKTKLIIETPRKNKIIKF